MQLLTKCKLTYFVFI